MIGVAKVLQAGKTHGTHKTNETLRCFLEGQKVAKMQQNHIQSTHETYEAGRKKSKPKNHTVEVGGSRPCAPIKTDLIV